MTSKIRIAILSVLFIVTIFIASFSIGSYIFYKENDFKNQVEKAKTSFAQEKGTPNLDTSMVFKLRVISTGETIVVKSVKLSSIISEFGKDNITIDDLKDKFSKEGYTLEGNFENKLTFVKNNKFKPGKFYLGEKNGFVAIYKCNEEGKLFIENFENDVLNVKIEAVPSSDRNLIVTNMFEFPSKQEAKDEVMGLTS